MKKDPVKYWFKRRRYGWGWTPVVWQGWTSFLVSFGAIFTVGMMLPTRPAQPSASQLTVFYTVLLVALLFLLAMSFLKGPRPHWRWGEKPDDNPDEDF